MYQFMVLNLNCGKVPGKKKKKTSEKSQDWLPWKRSSTKHIINISPSYFIQIGNPGFWFRPMCQITRPLGMESTMPRHILPCSFQPLSKPNMFKGLQEVGKMWSISCYLQNQAMILFSIFHLHCIIAPMCI